MKWCALTIFKVDQPKKISIVHHGGVLRADKLFG